MSNAPTTIKDYVGRTIDLVAYHGVNAGGDTLLEEALAEAGLSGAIVTGVQKVVQRVLTELLKERGSMTFRPSEGTNFLTEARIGAFQTQADVLGAFSRGISAVRQILAAEVAAGDPPDEIFVDAPVTSIVVSPGSAIIHFEVITQAGRDRKFIFPLRVPL